MVKKEWRIHNKDEKKSLIERLLSVRGVGKDEVETFLDPYSLTLTHPNAFCDMRKSVDRIAKAIDNSEKILIYGDFDADGVTSTSLLMKTLTFLGADVEYYIPTRENEGHGLSTNSLVKLMVKVKPKLIITVDCGISNVEEVAFINSFKKDIIITDHHEAPEQLPEAFGIINPKAPNSLDENLTATEIRYLSSLAGVGVAFKLAQGVLEHYDKLEYSMDILPFVAVGTIADVVPLVGENRFYVLKGLDLIRGGRHYGLKRLLETAGHNNIEDGITAEQVAFGIAPRINACGRLDSVGDAVKVLISENRQEVEVSVMALNNYNKIRQELCNEIFLEADKMAQNSRDNMLVLYKKDWHVGIIGIVASKLVEKYGKPAFLMMYSEDTNQIRCSARGVNGCDDLNLYEIISDVSDKLDGFGGHALAAGLYFSPEKSSFESVKKALLDSFDRHMNNKKIIPVLDIDLEIEPEDVTVDLVKDIARLEPFGASNPSPTFAIEGFTLRQKKLMGANKEHLKLVIEKDGIPFDAIWWSRGDVSLQSGDSLDVAFAPQINVFNGNVNLQLIIKDVHSDSLIEEDNSTNIIMHDDRRKTDILDKVNGYLANTKYEFSVFAEKNYIIERLRQYPEVFKRIVNRASISGCDGVMFFDYPPNQEILLNIISKASPSRIHFMKYEVDEMLRFNFLKTFAGMIKYSCNSRGGKFDLNGCACYLGITTYMVELLLQVFEENGSIVIKDRGEEFYIIELKQTDGIKIEGCQDCESYNDFTALLDEILQTQNEFMTCDLETMMK